MAHFLYYFLCHSAQTQLSERINLRGFWLGISVFKTWAKFSSVGMCVPCLHYNKTTYLSD
jgi:hypothetical protein